MKRTIPSIAFLFIISITSVRAEGGRNELASSKKNAPAVHNILSDKLPARLLTPIKKNYKDFWISDLYKTISNGKTSYCITVENADKKVIMNATTATGWSVTRVLVKE